MISFFPSSYKFLSWICTEFIWIFRGLQPVYYGCIHCCQNVSCLKTFLWAADDILFDINILSLTDRYVKVVKIFTFLLKTENSIQVLPVFLALFSFYLVSFALLSLSLSLFQLYFSFLNSQFIFFLFILYLNAAYSHSNLSPFCKKAITATDNTLLSQPSCRQTDNLKNNWLFWTTFTLPEKPIKKPSKFAYSVFVVVSSAHGPLVGALHALAQKWGESFFFCSVNAAHVRKTKTNNTLELSIATCSLKELLWKVRRKKNPIRLCVLSYNEMSLDSVCTELLYCGWLISDFYQGMLVMNESIQGKVQYPFWY